MANIKKIQVNGIEYEVYDEAAHKQINRVRNEMPADLMENAQGRVFLIDENGNPIGEGVSVSAKAETTAGEHITADLSGTGTVIATTDVYRGTVSVDRTDNDIASFDDVAVETGTAITVNGVTYDLSDDSKADTYSIDLGAGKVTRHKAITVVETGIADEWAASANGGDTYELARADAVAGTGFCSDPDTAVTSVNGKISTKRTATDGKNFTARLAEIDASKNRFSVFKTLGDTTKKGVALSATGGKIAETGTTFVQTSELIPIPEAYRDGTAELYINYYDGHTGVNKRSCTRIARVCFYNDTYNEESPVAGTFVYALNRGLNENQNATKSFTVPAGMTKVRFTVYIGDRITPTNATNWDGIGAIELSDFRVCFSAAEEDMDPIRIAYPVSTNIVLPDTFASKDQSTISATGTQYRAQYDKLHLLKEDVARNIQRIEDLEHNSPRYIDGQLFGDLNAPHIEIITGAYIDRNANLKIVPSSTEGRRLYYTEVTAGKRYSIYSESEKTIVAAIVEAPDKSALTSGYNANTSGYAYIVDSNIGATRDLGNTVQLTAPEPKTDGNKAFLLVQVSTSKDYPKNDIDAWYQTVFSRITISEGEPQGMIRTSRVIPKEMLEDELIHEPYRSEGEKFAVAKAEQFRDIKWTPIASGMKTASETDYPANVEQTGLPYSSVKALNQYIGIDVLPETFLSALKNPNSIMYHYNAKTVKAVNRYLSVTAENGYYPIGTDVFEASQASEFAGSYYGTVCSALTGYCVGLPTYETTYSLLHTPGIAKENDLSAYGCHRGSIILGQHYLTKGGHVGLVTDVERSNDGEIRYVSLVDSSLPVVKYSKKEPRELFDSRLSFSRNGEYSQNTILRYDPIEKNIVCEFDVKALRGYTTGSGTICTQPNVIVLDDRFDRVGCVYYIRTDTQECIPIYEGTADNPSLHWEFTPKDVSNPFSAPLIKIVGMNKSDGKIAVSPVDTMKSYIVPDWAYNLRGDIALDRGNRSSYRRGESVKVSNLSVDAVNIVIKNADTGAVWVDLTQGIGKKTVATGNNSFTGGYTQIAAGQGLVIDTSGIPAGYYTITSEDESKEPLELFIYDTGAVAISAESFVDGDCAKGLANQVKGKITGAALAANGYALMTPLYASLTTTVGVVGRTSDNVSMDNRGNISFAIGKMEFPAEYNASGKVFDCVRVHFVTRYGRVITEPCILQTKNNT